MLPALAMDDVTLSTKIEFLSDPRSYPHHPFEVVARETHWAWVFLASGLVYKFKKPCLRPGMDFRSLASRRRACENELRVNRRFSPDIYHGLVPLVRRDDGRLGLGGMGEVVEWLLEMRQLPIADCMDARIARGRLRDDHAIAAGQAFAEFYRAGIGRGGAEAGSIYLAHIRAETKQTRRLFETWDLGPDTHWVRRLLPAFDVALKAAEPEIRKRSEQGLIVDGHGDLRPEHVCVGTSVTAFDSLEFDDDMRLIDPYDEQNYLGLECELLGAAWVRPILLAQLRNGLGSEPSPHLIATYGAFRCLLRARICLEHLLDEQPMTPALWPGLALRYLRLAARELAVPC